MNKGKGIKEAVRKGAYFSYTYKSCLLHLIYVFCFRIYYAMGTDRGLLFTSPLRSSSCFTFQQLTLHSTPTIIILQWDSIMRGSLFLG